MVVCQKIFLQTWPTWLMMHKTAVPHMLTDTQHTKVPPKNSKVGSSNDRSFTVDTLW
jgi:hypothetical protein